MGLGAVLLVAIGALVFFSEDVSRPLERGKPAPDFSLPLLGEDGQPGPEISLPRILLKMAP